MNFERIVRTMEQHRQRTGEKLMMSRATYLALIQSYAKQSRFDDALKVFHHMCQAGLSPDKAEITHALLTTAKKLSPEKLRAISQFAHNLRLQAITTTSRRAGEVLGATAPHSGPMTASASAHLMLLLQACIRASDVVKCDMVLKQMRANIGMQMTEEIYCLLFECARSARNLEALDRWWHEMRDVDQVEPRSAAYTALLQSYLQLGRLDRALLVFRDIAERGMRPTRKHIHVLASYVAQQIGNPASITQAALDCLKSIGVLISDQPIRVAEGPSVDRPSSPGQLERLSALLVEVQHLVAVQTSAALAAATTPVVKTPAEITNATEERTLPAPAPATVPATSSPVAAEVASSSSETAEPELNAVVSPKAGTDATSVDEPQSRS